MPRRIILLILAVVLGLLPFRGLATSVIAPDFNTLVNEADYVVRAVVKSVNSEWRENEGRRYIATMVELQVSDIVKGTPPQSVILQMVGGTVGPDTLTVTDAPKFVVGDDAIFFVQGNGRQMYPLVAIMHGLYPVYRDSQSNLEYVVRSNGMPLYTENDVSLPMSSLSTIKAQNPASRPMSVAAFEQKIRAAASTSARTAQQR
jgi:hypothetical protein